MKLTLRLFSDGSMTASYSDGRPALRYFGEWTKLKLLEKDVKNFSDSGLTKEEKPTDIHAYFEHKENGHSTVIKIPYSNIQQITRHIKAR
jgi:hypothetical protein